jgi:hypothetical protein
MKIAIHQPNYLPWLGYFRKIAIADVFVFFDDVQFEKGGFTNRVGLRVGEQAKWLTQPVVKHGILNSTIADLQFASSGKWSESHLKIIEQYYQNRPFYSELQRLVATIFAESSGGVADFNIRAINLIVEALGIETKLIRATNLNYVREATASEKLASICKVLNGKTYYSGNGGRNYNNLEIFDMYGITVAYDNWHPIEYQQGGNYIPGLSVIDAIANVGLKKTASFLDKT